jgi:hypothetical protein
MEHSTLTSSTVRGALEVELPMPAESFTPLLVAAGLGVLFAGLIGGLDWLAALGAGIAALSLAAWHWPHRTEVPA